MKNKKMGISAAIVIVAMLIIGGFTIYSDDEKEGNNNSIEIVFNDDITTIEYGTEDFDINSLIKKVDGTIVSYPEIDTHDVGTHEYVFVVEKDGEQKKFTRTIEIVNSSIPLIEINEKTVTITVGSEFDPLSNIKRVYAVEGDLNYINQDELLSKPKATSRDVGATVTKDIVSYYTIKNEVNTNVAGTYNVTITAVDKFGMQSEMSYTVVVQ